MRGYLPTSAFLWIIAPPSSAWDERGASPVVLIQMKTLTFPINALAQNTLKSTLTARAREKKRKNYTIRLFYRGGLFYLCLVKFAILFVPTPPPSHQTANHLHGMPGDNLWGPIGMQSVAPAPPRSARFPLKTNGYY